jgi:hypothetical protein
VNSFWEHGKTRNRFTREGTHLHPKRLSARRFATWLMMASGILLGSFALLRRGKIWIPHGPTDSFAAWFNDVGIGLLGLVFLISSLAALRHPRAAGLALLVSAPVTAFCVASGAHPWATSPQDKDYSGLLIAAVIGCLFFIPFFTSLSTICSRRHAVYLSLISAFLAGLVCAMSQRTELLLILLAVFSAPSLAFGWFWLGTSKRR